MGKILKDICTLANGEDYCVAGIATILAVLLGFAVMAYVFVVVKPTAVADIAEMLKSFAIYHGSILTAGTTGKYITNQAEPNQPAGGS